ncbi:outer membrane beta-barrel protein [Helicobacter pylori]|uniref:Hop family adhesin SabA n=1 Tax=Helicobacter pylori TaxID=210 RepID=UPI00257746D6|nr:SabA family sialic acid-binding adhesin [Helicobacter pylori]WJI99486.1 outer membrane beta-barrel protein [Helicobacter pylori]WJI99905.1 outer membrane beta-barrel protein [Helicobacter pylori]WJJ05436.1 outer membrane beta-barrel protein [Helicobacter pylori]WJJ05856.1 outer membrane beta-barrel protein [Helicobacter pylori]
MKIKKSLLLSLSLMASLSRAEDDGFYMSVGYQIGEAVQKVKNTGALQNLADRYDNLSNLLNQYNYLNSLVNLASTPSAITGAIDNLSSSAINLTSATTTSPAYQAVALALNAAVGMWQVIAFGISCGPGPNLGPEHLENGGVRSFDNTPNYSYNTGSGTTTTTCNGASNVGPNGILSSSEYQVLNTAYQTIQTALNQSQGGGMPALNSSKNMVVNINQTFTRNPTTEYTYPNGNGNYYSGGSSIPIQLKISSVNDAKNLLQQAATIINVLTTQNPHVNGGGGAWGFGGKTGTVMDIFGDSFNAINEMIKNAQTALEKTKQLNANENTQITQPDNFNPYTSEDKGFAKEMLNRANAQAEILNLAKQVADNFHSIQGPIQQDLEECTAGSAGVINDNTYGSGCAFVKETLNSLEQHTAYYGNQVNQEKALAQTILNFKEALNTLNKDSTAINSGISHLPNAKSLQNMTHSTQNPNSPEGLLTYSLDTNKYSQLQTTAQELGKNPFRRFGVIDYQNNNGAMNGIGVQVGYKQFFGKKRNWGLRYYGFFDYNHAYIKSNFFNSASDVWTYGVGMDALYNFINDKNTNFLGKNNKLSVGLFGGFALAGTSWLNSQQVNLTMMNGIYNANVSTSNFQFLFDLGLRMNLARPKKKDSDHSTQHGIELGFKIPTINTNYYSFMGAKLEYRRMYSLFLNYVFAY